MSELHIKLGKLLKLERERRGVKLDDLAADLKVSEEYLLAIEEGDPSRLPSDLYYNLFAKSYAGAMDIDFTATVEAIKEDIGQPLEAEVEEPSRGDKVADKGKKKDKKVTGETGEEETEEADETRSDSPIKKLLWIVGIIVLVFLAFVVTYEVFLKGDAPRQAETLPAEVEIKPEEKPEETTAGSGYDWSIPPYQEPQPIRLTLQGRAESWASVTADGDTVLFRTLTPGRVYEVEADHRMHVSVGIPSVVDVTLEGEPVNLVHPETGRISRVEINQLNFKDIIRGEVPLARSNQIVREIEPTTAPATPVPTQSEANPNPPGETGASPVERTQPAEPDTAGQQRL